MSKKFIEFNNKTIFFVAADGQYWIALKPICEALNVNWNRQFQNLKNNEMLKTVFAIQQMQAPDNQLRNYVALPEFYVYGWLMQIQSDSVELQKFQWECYKVLYNHFKGMVTQREELLRVKTLDELEIERLEAELENSDAYKKIQGLRTANKRRNTMLRNLDKSLVSSQLELWKQQ